MKFSEIIGHEDIISHFRSSIETGRVAHAYIIGGDENSGRSTLAYCFAKALQCEKGGSESCDECKSCHQAETHNHPDIIFVEKGEDDSVMSIETIREQVVSSIQIKPYSSKYKIYIIEDGEKMTVEAENALLKTIEEPPEYGIIIIITTNPEKLLPTIRSRCITVMTHPVKERDIHDYLTTTYDISEKRANFAVEYAQGNLGKAILIATNEDYGQLVQSVVELETNIFDMNAEDIEAAIKACTQHKLSISDYLDLMMMWYRDILIIKVTGNPDRVIYKEQYLTIREQAKYLSFNELEAKAQAIENAKKRIEANANMEDIMRLLIMTLREK